LKAIKIIAALTAIDILIAHIDFSAKKFSDRGNKNIFNFP